MKPVYLWNEKTTQLKLYDYLIAGSHGDWVIDKGILFDRICEGILFVVPH